MPDMSISFLFRRPIASLLCLVVTLGIFHPRPASGASGALISQLKGQVTLLSRPGDATGFPARALQFLGDGARLRLGRQAEALVICSDDHSVRLEGPKEWQAGPGSCAGGRALAAGTYNRLVPGPGRVRTFHGALLEEPPSKSDEDGIPVLLEPRGPQREVVVLIGDASPRIGWAEVPRALSYELILKRGGRELKSTVLASAARCERDARVTKRRACFIDWPWRLLADGEEVSLWVEAETDDPDWRRRVADASRLRLASAAVRRKVEASVKKLEASGLPIATQNLLAANAYSEARFFNEAATALATVLEKNPTGQAALAVRLADLYLGLGLLSSAGNLYSQASSMLPRRGENEVRAPLHLGLARLALRRKDTLSAIENFKKAERYFSALEWTAEVKAAAAERALAERFEPGSSAGDRTP